MATKGYTALATIQAYLGETFNDTSVPTSDAVNTMIEWSEKLIDDYTDTSFTAATVTDEVLDSDGLREFLLPKVPIISITNFYVDKGGLGATATDWDERTEGRTNADDFIIKGDGSSLYFHNNFPNMGIQNIKTSYTYGHETVPKDVEKLATLLVTKEIVKSRLADNMYSSQDTIRVGPIMISKSSGQLSEGLSELHSEIDEAWKAVGKFKSILY
jgi:hypothetical protein